MWWLVGYLAGVALTFRAIIRFAKYRSDYDWDMEAPDDLWLLTLLALLGSIVWPATVVFGCLSIAVKKTYDRG